MPMPIWQSDGGKVTAAFDDQPPSIILTQRVGSVSGRVARAAGGAID